MDHLVTYLPPSDIDKYVIIFLLTLLTYVLVVWWKTRDYPPGPWGVPILGYLPFLNTKAPHESLAKLGKEYGRIFGLYLGNVYTVVLTDVKLIRKVLARDDMAGRAPLYVTHGIMKGYGVICAQGDLWKDQRKFLNGCLRQFGVQKYGPKRHQIEQLLMTEIVDCIDYIKARESEPLEPISTLRHNLGSAINKIVFGISYERDDGIWQWLQHLQEEGVQYIGVAGPLNFLPFLRFIPKYKNIMRFLLDGKERTHKLYQKIIDNAIAKPVPGNVLEAFLAEKERRKDTPDYDNFYNQQQFYHMLADVFGAGLDTTLVTLGWYLLYMADNLDAQTKIQEEIDAILGDRKATIDDFNSLPLIEASVAEVQRIRSVVPLGIPHGSLEDAWIEGHFVPKGSMIVPLQWQVHMNEDVWKEPEKFDPSRFINEEGKFTKRDSFIPFQTGKRMCIGDELARIIMLLFVTNIMQNFRVTIKEGQLLDLEGITGITLSPKPQSLIFTSRK